MTVASVSLELTSSSRREVSFVSRRFGMSFSSSSNGKMTKQSCAAGCKAKEIVAFEDSSSGWRWWKETNFHVSTEQEKSRK